MTENTISYFTMLSLVFLILYLLVCSDGDVNTASVVNDYVDELYASNQYIMRQSRKLKSKYELIVDHSIKGTTTLVPNITVFGAILMSEAGQGNLEINRHSWRSEEHQINASTMAAIRTNHARHMYNQLPFPVVEWPAVFTRQCPQNRRGHKTERGLALAHYQIWLDFVYFDNALLADLAAAKKSKLGRLQENIKSTSWSSVSGVFEVCTNGTLYKNGNEYKEDDIIVIFEDDADIAVLDINTTMYEELSMMTTDILFLGWCDGRLARPVPLCAHAYALTRRGARKVIEHFEPCGLALDEQFVIMGKNKWITFRTAHPWSWVKRYNSEYPKNHDATKGIFHQKRMGSFNGH